LYYTVSAVIENILIGLITSVVSATAVWLWQRAARARYVRRRGAFFSLGRGATCLIIMNNKWNMPGSTEQNDVTAMVEVATLATELGAKVVIKSCSDFKESNGDRTEYCIGGPESNPRTAWYLASCLPRVTANPYIPSRPDSVDFVIGDQRFPYEPGKREHALAVKFLPPGGRRPVVLICGQTSITNIAAIHLLKRDYRALGKTLTSTEQFCVVVRVTAPEVYGYEMADVAADVSDAAFGVLSAEVTTTG
jgi:hypothetical protein